MSFGNDSELDPISESLIQSQAGGWELVRTHQFKLHTVYTVYWTLFWDLGADKTSTTLSTNWSGPSARRQAAEFKFESKFEPLPVIWQSTPKAIPEDNWRFWLQNQWPSASGSAPAQLSPAQTQGVSESAAVAAGRDLLTWGEAVLPLLLYWLSPSIKKMLMLCRYRAPTSHFFVVVKWNFRWKWREVVAEQIASLNLSIIHWSLSRNMT